MRANKKVLNGIGRFDGVLTLYEGLFEDDDLVNGRYIQQDGSYYIGQCILNMPNGHGKRFNAKTG